MPREQPVGQCIYCLAVNDLTDEHIIPFGIGGTWVLPAASCLGCSTATSQFERRLLRGAWAPIRAAIDTPTRRRHPRDWEVEVEKGGRRVVRRLPTARTPLVVPVLDFDQPSALTGGEPAFEGAVARGLSAWVPRTLELDDVLLDLPTPLFLPRRVTMATPLDAGDLLRLVAKVALGAAVARHGLSNLKDVHLRPVILGDLRDAGRWVGGALLHERITEVPGLHGVEVETRSDGTVIGRVQFFRQSPGVDQPPVYQAVVGTFADDATDADVEGASAQ